MKQMSAATRFRMICILLLWLMLCWILIVQSPRITFQTIFVIVASGIIVFVPLYKKHLKDGKDRHTK